MDNSLKSIVKLFTQNVEIDMKTLREIENVPTAGSGFFINDNGHILTCAHVISSSKKIYAHVSSDKKKYECSIISFCPELDIAVIKIHDYENKNFLKMYNKFTVGCDVQAFGYPMGAEDPVITKGIISSFDGLRIITDSAINPGNSGGPLLNSTNQVIGINSAKLVGKDVDNIGFATPIQFFFNYGKIMFGNKQKGITITHASIFGYRYQRADDTIRKYYGVTGNTGVLISQVERDSPMEKIGIKFGDFLLKMNGHTIDENAYISGDFDVGKFSIKIDYYCFHINWENDFEIEFFSKKQKKIVRSKLKLFPYQMCINSKFPLYEKINLEVLPGGLILQDMNLDLLEAIPNIIPSLSFLTKFNKSSIVVCNVIPNSHVFNLDIFKEGNVITRINDTNVSSVQDIRKIILKTNPKFLKIKDYDNNELIYDVEKNKNIDMNLLETVRNKIKKNIKNKTMKKNVYINNSNK